MDKAKLKEIVVGQQEEVVGHLEDAIEDLKVGQDIDEEDTIDPEDFSHQNEAGGLLLRYRTRLAEAKAELERAKEIPLEKCEMVQVGALIETNKMNFFVGISSLPFEHEDKDVVGISTSAPVYVALLEKKVGDNITLAGKAYKITGIS